MPVVKTPVKVQATAKPVPKAIEIVLPTRPTRMAKKLTDYVMMFFGPPGVGKTSFVDELTNQRTLFLSTDRGTRFRNMMRLECHTWSKIEAVIKKLEADPATTKSLYDAICIDHVDDAVNMLEDKVCEDLKVEALGDAGFGKGWKAYRRGIERVIHRVMRLGLGVIFISHEEIKTVETRVSKVDRTMPALSKTAWKVIVPLADVIGFCGYKTLKTDSGRKEIRTIETSPREDLYVKDRTDRVKPAKGWEVLDAKKFQATFAQTVTNN